MGCCLFWGSMYGFVCDLFVAARWGHGLEGLQTACMRVSWSWDEVVTQRVLAGSGRLRETGPRHRVGMSLLRDDKFSDEFERGIGQFCPFETG